VIRSDGAVVTSPRKLAMLVRDFRIRIVNCSPSGCLLETNARLEVGTIGTLRFTVDGRELSDDIQVVRCQPIEGAGSLYHVGAKFLLTAASSPKGTLRRAFSEPTRHEERGRTIAG
jgi:hypothetical protein